MLNLFQKFSYAINYKSEKNNLHKFFGRDTHFNLGKSHGIFRI